MELKNLIIKEKKFFGLASKGWSRPYTVERFVNEHISFTERINLLKDREAVQFFDIEKKPLSYQEGYNKYLEQEERYLNAVLEKQKAYFSFEPVGQILDSELVSSS